ncbi:MAG: hypothetical protein ACHQ7M_20720, partial [Chloroflexota bacterium]
MDNQASRCDLHEPGLAERSDQSREMVGKQGEQVVVADIAGGNHEQYRTYLEAKYLDQFDAWRGKYSNPFKDLSGGTKDRNWNQERRISELEADGVVAEVLF